MMYAQRSNDERPPAIVHFFIVTRGSRPGRRAKLKKKDAATVEKIERDIDDIIWFIVLIYIICMYGTMIYCDILSISRVFCFSFRQ